MPSSARPAGDDDRLPENRLRFGLVAEEYDRIRPGYPAALIDALTCEAGVRAGDAALDVGTGTGQVAVALAARGLDVLGVDPSEAMVAVANRKFAAAGLPARAVVGEFERAPLPERSFALIAAGTCWHWLDSNERFRAAARAIAPGGMLAALWTWPQWRTTALRDEFDAIYRRSGAPLEEMGPMCLNPPSPEGLTREWVLQTERAPGFGEPGGAMATSTIRYTAAGYCALLSTYSDHIGLAPTVRAALLSGIERAIDGAGGAIDVPYTTLLLTARAVLGKRPALRTAA